MTRREDTAAGEAGIDPLAERQLDSALVYDGELLRVFRDRVICPDGHVGTREIIRHPGAAAIVALLDDGRVVLERQYRYALARSFIEIPAGKLEAGEPALACARRELLEETGFVARQWQMLGAFNNAIGFSDERIDIFLARDLSYQGGSTDDGEVLEVFCAPWQDLLEWVRTGAVTDVKTIIAAHWLERLLSGAWPQPPVVA